MSEAKRGLARLATVLVSLGLPLVSAFAGDLRLSIAVREPGGTVQFEYPSRESHYYILDQADTLGSDSRPCALGLGQAGTGQLSLAPPTSTAFFRLREVPVATPMDSDGDGMDDVFELRHPAATDPLDAADAYADADGDGYVNLVEFERGMDPETAALVTVVSSPAPGETGVAVTRETVLRFTAPLASAVSLTPDTFYAVAGGRRVLARVELSGGRDKATLFPLEPMPGGTRVRVTFDGNAATDHWGRQVDADGDGLPGGWASIEFTTSSLGLLPGTGMEGRVFASELAPGPGPGVFVDAPLAGVRISVDGLEETAWTTTDAEGRFRLSPCPGGDFFVHVDGRTAVGSDWPQGAYYPVVGKQWRAVPGVQTNLAAGTGRVYLPKILPGTLQAVHPTSSTRIAIPQDLVAAHPELAEVSLLVPPNALFNDQGVRGGRVGLAPVSPDRLPEPLPPGLQFPIVITVQTDGPSNFDQPVAVRFPNLPDPVTGLRLPPGAKSALWSFNHDTGRWELQGPMTVTPDGLYVDSDVGVGIRQPGWHAPFPGSQTLPPCPPRDEQPNRVTPDLRITVPEATLLTNDGDVEMLTFANRPPAELALSDLLCETTRNRPVRVELEWEGPVDDFLEGAEADEFDLYPGGAEHTVVIQAKALQGDLWSIAHDRMYSATLRLKVFDPVTREPLLDRSHYFYRYLDAADARHGDGIVSMPDTTRGVVRTRPLEHFGPAKPTLAGSGSPHFPAGGYPDRFEFAPQVAAGKLSASVEVRAPNGAAAGTLTLEGHAKSQKVFVDRAAFEKELGDLVALGPTGAPSPTERSLLATPADRAEVVQGAVDTALGLMAELGDGIAMVASAEPDAIVFGSFTTPLGETKFGRSDTVDALSNGGYLELLKHCASYSPTEQNYRLSRILNQLPAGSVQMFLKNYFAQVEFTSGGQLAASFGKSLAHEVGHAVGLTHTAGTDDNGTVHFAGGDPTAALADIMAQGEDKTGSRRFKLSAQAFRVAVGEQWDESGGQNAVDYYRQFAVAGGNFDGPLEERDANAAAAPAWEGPVAWMLALPERRFMNSPFALGAVEADGPGGAVLQAECVLRNMGDQALVVESLSFGSASPGWSITPVTPATVVPPGGELPLTLAFDPMEAGLATAELSVHCNAVAGPLRVRIEANGTASGPALRVILRNNNLGGARPGAPASLHPGTLTLQNLGAQPLHVTGIRFEQTDLPSPFRLPDLSAPPTSSDPLVLAPGASRAFTLAFQPARRGLLRGELVIASDDPRYPVKRLPMVGTGLPDRPSEVAEGNHHILVTMPLTTNAPVRLRSSSDGFWTTFLPGETPFEASAFDPSTGLLARYRGKAAAPGLPTRIATPFFRASVAPDTDGDGLPDDIERVLGTATHRPDTDGDGMTDFHALLNGLDPLAGRPDLTGPRSVAPTAGEALDLALGEGIVVVAEGAKGISVFQEGKEQALSLLGRVETPAPARRVSVWGQWAVADLDQAGLAILDLATPGQPRLSQVIALPGGSRNAVLATEGFALAGGRAASKLIAIDLASGQTRSELTLTDSQVVDLCRRGNRIYALTSQGLHTLALEFGELRSVNYLELQPYPSPSRVTAGDGMLAVTRFAGFDRLGLGNANAPTPLGTYEDFSLTWQQVAPSAPDRILALADGATAGGATNVAGRGVNLFRLAPDGTPVFERRFPTQRAPKSGVVRDGRLYLALGSDGLMILGFLPVETQGSSPQVTLTADVALPGVVEQRAFAVWASATDDTQVQSVELFVNDALVARDVAFPFDFVITAPARHSAPDGLRLRARAVDHGGLAAWSSEVVVPLLQDTVGPSLVSHTQIQGRTFGANSLREVRVRLDEPLAPGSVTAATFELVALGPDGLPGTGDDQKVPAAQPVYVPGTLQLTLLAAEPLPPGRYQVRLGPGITDLAGNGLLSPPAWTCAVYHVDATAQSTFAIDGNIDQPRATDSYSLAVSAGQRLFFKFPEFDLWGTTAPEVGWWFIGPDGTALRQGTLGYQVLGATTFSTAGVYTLVFGGDAYTDTGAFRVECTPIPEDQRFPVVPGMQVGPDQPSQGAGRIEARGARDVYTFSGAAGSSVELTGVSHSEGLTYVAWRLADEVGGVVFERFLSGGDPGRILLQRGGTYTLEVGSDTDPGTGTYSFSLQP